MSEESLFMTDNPSGNGPDNGNSQQLFLNTYMGQASELDLYDLEDPFINTANMDESFGGNFLESHTHGISTGLNFSLDPTSMDNAFSNNFLPTYETSGELSSGANSNMPFDTPSMMHKDSPFDVTHLNVHDPDSRYQEHLGNDYEDQGNVSNEEQEQEDSLAPKRSRATGELLALLIAEFQKNINPNGAVRKQLADSTGMSERSVRIWFQNRRAKLKKMEKMSKDGSSTDQRRNSDNWLTGDSAPNYINKNRLAMVGANSSMNTLQQQAKAPITINENYCLVDCNSISIGTWQRIKSGYINSQILKNLINLSPKFLNSLMFSTDLLIILSKKNQEMNYFFSGFFQNNKILFRIFYPLESILSCSLLNQLQQIGDNKNEASYVDGAELRLTLSTSPKFAVFFLNNTATGRENTNQWSICDDFSEGQQVNNAFVGEGGTDVPHILVGVDHEALQFLNNYILQYHQQQLMQLQVQLLQQPSDVLGAGLGEQDAEMNANNELMNVSNGDDFLLESLEGVGDISGADTLLGFSEN